MAYLYGKILGLPSQNFKILIFYSIYFLNYVIFSKKNRRYNKFQTLELTIFK